MAMMDKSEKVPKQIQPVFDAVVVLTDAFCKEYLNEEYRHLARRATAAMCRKRLTPLVNTRSGLPKRIDSVNVDLLL